jgi:hypothetical protein
MYKSITRTNAQTFGKHRKGCRFSSSLKQVESIFAKNVYSNAYHLHLKVRNIDLFEQKMTDCLQPTLCHYSSKKQFSFLPYNTASPFHEEPQWCKEGVATRKASQQTKEGVATRPIRIFSMF